MNDLIEEDLRLTFIVLKDFDQLFHVGVDVPLSLKELEQHILIGVFFINLKYICSLILLLNQLLMMLLENITRFLLVKLNGPFLARISILVALLNCVLDTYACN